MKPFSKDHNCWFGGESTQEVTWCELSMATRSSLPDADATVEADMFELQGDGGGAQSLISRLQWEDSPEISPTDSASSRASKLLLRSF